jgi:branched-chain amino acid transport system ATP-binding protein
VTAEPVLLCQGLDKHYGAVHAVQQVSFRLDAGEILGLVGPNGAGKTTLVDLIGGEQGPDSGSAVLAGRRLAGPPSRRARVNGLTRTFQHPQVALEMTVRENVLIGYQARSLGTLGGLVWSALRGLVAPGTAEADQVIAEIASAVGLPDIGRRCSELTLGELRLVEVARALAARPKVILLDEPFAGGDIRGVAGISRALREIVQTGCGVILVDHNVDLVAALVNRIVLLNFGKIVFDGDVRECLASPEMQEVYFGVVRH